MVRCTDSGFWNPEATKELPKSLTNLLVGRTLRNQERLRRGGGDRIISPHKRTTLPQAKDTVEIKWGYDATAAHLTPDQLVGGSDLSALRMN